MAAVVRSSVTGTCSFEKLQTYFKQKRYADYITILWNIFFDFCVLGVLFVVLVAFLFFQALEFGAIFVWNVLKLSSGNTLASEI